MMVIVVHEHQTIQMSFPLKGKYVVQTGSTSRKGENHDGGRPDYPDPESDLLFVVTPKI